MLKSAILALIRQILTVAGTALVAKGYVQASDIEPVIGALLTIGSVIWSVADKRGEVTAHRFLRRCCGIGEASVGSDPLGWQTRAIAEHHPCTWIDLVYRHRALPPDHALLIGRVIMRTTSVPIGKIHARSPCGPRAPEWPRLQTSHLFRPAATLAQCAL